MSDVPQNLTYSTFQLSKEFHLSMLLKSLSWWVLSDDNSSVHFAATRGRGGAPGEALQERRTSLRLNRNAAAERSYPALQLLSESEQPVRNSYASNVKASISDFYPPDAQASSTQPTPDKQTKSVVWSKLLVVLFLLKSLCCALICCHASLTACFSNLLSWRI